MSLKVERSRFYRETIEDMSPDPSYLEQEGFEDRLAAYRRGEFGYIGLRAVVNVFIPCPAPSTDKIIQQVQSPGLWGIESDSPESYCAEVYAEECAVLEDMLTSMGMTVVP